ncbi:MAG: flagellar motor protein MotB [Dongiaceae bacterium]
MADATIIIKKVKKGHGHGHHGGAWKVAYADFVTAMMAFFLLLWLLNATTEEQRLGIADYFAPSVAPDATSGSGGVLGGTTVESEGAMQDQSTSPSVTVELTTPVEGEGEDAGQGPQPDAGIPAATETPDATRPADSTRTASAAMPAPETVTPPPAEIQAPNDAEAQKLIEELEEEQFREAEHQLRQAIQQVPDLKSLAQNLIIDRTPEGMRIQLVDQDQVSMFPLGSADMMDHTRKLLRLVADVIDHMPNKISISGHTDSKPFANDKGYSNWELSADRANASRRELLAMGVDPARIAYVTGKADQDPLLPNDTANPRNRRISIVLLREHPDSPAP